MRTYIRLRDVCNCAKVSEFSVDGLEYPIFPVNGVEYPIFSVNGLEYPIFSVNGVESWVRGERFGMKRRVLMTVLNCCLM